MYLQPVIDRNDGCPAACLSTTHVNWLRVAKVSINCNVHLQDSIDWRLRHTKLPMAIVVFTCKPLCVALVLFPVLEWLENYRRVGWQMCIISRWLAAWNTIAQEQP